MEISMGVYVSMVHILIECPHAALKNRRWKREPQSRGAVVIKN